MGCNELCGSEVVMNLIEDIKANYGRDTVQEIADRHGKTYRQVYYLAAERLGLRKNNNRTRSRTLAVAQECESYLIFREDHPSEYQFARKNGLLDEIKKIFDN